MNLLSNLTFGNPLALWSLFSIPGVWLLLKIYPPSPKIVTFPPLNFLLKINNDQQTASNAPLWLLLYRILFLTLLIFAFANPIYNTKPIFEKSGPVFLLIDNGWSSSTNWESKKEKIYEYINHAEQNNKSIIISLTAQQNKPSDSDFELLSASKARSIIETLVPVPWASDYKLLYKKIESIKINEKYNIFWFWDGVNHNKQETTQSLVNKLENIGSLTVIDYFNNTPIKIIKNVINETNNELLIEMSRNLGSIQEKVFLRANGPNGEILNRTEATFEANKRNTKAIILIPNDLKNNLSSISIEDQNSAGSIYLFDEKWKKRSVGIVGDKNTFRTQPLLSPAYYLDRAIKPFSEIMIDDLSLLLEKKLSVIILPGIGTIRNELNNKLKAWIKNGGMLIRFAGPNLEGANTDLLPVKLRSLDSRVFGGALSWDKPVSIKTFPIGSPLYGITIQDDILINKQVIAEPSPNLLNNTWASLKDGTPLITAKKIDKGINIFFHITANAEWSNMPLTGTFVEILERLISLSTGNQEVDDKLPLKPFKLLNSFGRLVDPPNNSLPINFSDKDNNYVNRAPGYYGNELFLRVLNLTDNIKILEPKTVTFKEETSIEKFISEKSIQLKSLLLTLIILLAIFDAIISLKIKGKINSKSFKKILKFSIILFFICNANLINKSYAQNKVAAIQTQLAYIITKNEKINQTSYLGLLELTKIMKERTSIEASPPAGINITSDDISFYPLLYWPIINDSYSLTDKVISKIQDYMKNGGLIIFDTRDANPSKIITNISTEEQNILKALLKDLDLPLLINVPNDHVLKRSFYLLDTLPGRYSGGNVWVEATEKNSRDGVSSVIIGGNDWASAWAKDKNNQPLFSVIPGGEKQREFSYRFGINLVMYAMTGNYKADQVHIKSILNRLNKKNNNMPREN